MNDSDTEMTALTDFHRLGQKRRPCLTVVSGQNAAQRYWIDRPENLIGRLYDAHVILNEANVSRRHARILALGQLFMIEDLNSTNGTFLNGERLYQANQLNDGDLIGIGKTVIKFSIQTDTETAFYQEVLESARTDSLTGLLSRQFFDKQLLTEFTRVQRYGGNMNLMLCDLDDFKRINDRYGHPGGDLVLTQVGKLIQDCLRANLDVAGRYGGEELAILLPEISARQAAVVAERIRKAMQAHVMHYRGHELRATLSIGLASVDAGSSTVQELIRDADRYLYRAKHKGKNRVEA